jgi:N-methylhydantoinase A
MGYVVATDVGGTCTDAVIVKDGQSIVLGKALSTPPNYAQGVIDSLESATNELGIGLETLLSETTLFMHGSTVVDNTLIERTGANTGLLITEGFEDTLLVTRGAYGRWSGLSEEGLKHPVATDRAPALVPLDRSCGVAERVDYKGAVLRELDEDSVEKAIRHLIETKGVKAIAVCLLWSFKNPVHEQRIKDLIKGISKETYVSISSEVAPVLGEFERASTTVINAYAGPVVNSYVTDLQNLLNEYNYKEQFLVMQGYGGLLPGAEAADRAVGMVECGPVAGVIGSKFLGDVMGDRDIIAADMGGTTFKVGVIQNGELEYAREPMVDRYHYAVPKIDVVSIGAGGGSIISLEAGTMAPIVGPKSAGASPGPICYGLGGQEPTLTDVLLLIGYIDPSIFLNGTMTLDIDTARRIFDEKIATPMGLSVEDAACGIFRVAASQVTDLIHKITVEQGLDPRDFVLHSFGGSGPMLASTFGRELHVKKIIVPYTASVNCAFGLVSADIVHKYSTSKTLTVPVPAEEINTLYEPMISKAHAALEQDGFKDEQMSFEWSVGFRYASQVHELVTSVHAKTPIDKNGVAKLVDDFETLYEKKYGKGSAFREAGIEMTQFHLIARGNLQRPELAKEPLNDSDSSYAKIGQRQIFIEGRNKFGKAEIYDFERIIPGNEISGPAVIHTPITTIVIQDEQIGRMDGYRNIVIEGE